MRPLDLAPAPGRPVRALFGPETIADELWRSGATARSGANVAALGDRGHAVAVWRRWTPFTVGVVQAVSGD